MNVGPSEVGAHANWVELDAVGPAAPLAPAAPAGPVRAPDLGPENPMEKLMACSAESIFENKGAMRSPGIEDFRSPAAAAAAMTKPLAVPEGAKPFGPTTIYRPGLANTHCSPAFIFRMARYTDKLLIAYPNAKPGQDLTPRPATEIAGVPVPPELRGKIFVSGDTDPRMIPWETASDLFMKQLEAADHSAFLGGGAAADAKMTVIAHSQGGLDAAETRRRLEAAGRPNEFGKLVALNSPFAGSPLADETGAGLLAKALGATAGGRAPEAIRHLDPDYMRGKFSFRDRQLVDVAVTATADGTGAAGLRPLMKGLAMANRYNPCSPARGSNDGFVSRESQSFGKSLLPLARAYDHASIVEDPAVMDDLARALAKQQR